MRPSNSPNTNLKNLTMFLKILVNQSGKNFDLFKMNFLVFLSPLINSQTTPQIWTFSYSCLQRSCSSPESQICVVTDNHNIINLGAEFHLQKRTEKVLEVFIEYKTFCLDGIDQVFKFLRISNLELQLYKHYKQRNGITPILKGCDSDQYIQH